MIPSTVHFITGMKLRELRRQREQFRGSYRGLHQAVEEAPDSIQRLRRLYHGLQELKFAGQPLHPDVVNLEIALGELEAGTLAPDVVSLWQGRLENELSAGQLRCEFVYLFGALLEEWGRKGSGNAVLREQSAREGQRLLENALTAEEPNRHDPFFDSMLQGLEPALADLPRRVEEKRAEEGAIPPLLGKDLKRIASDIYQPPRVRKEANDFLANQELLKELGDALTIFLAELGAWDWSAEGLGVRPLWTRNKWRLYLDLDLPTTCLLEAVGVRWVFLWEELFGRSGTAQAYRARLRKLQSLNAPQVIIENERRQLERARQMAFLGLPDEGGGWDAEDTPSVSEVEEFAFKSIRQERWEQLTRMRTLRVGGDYDGGEYGEQTTTLQLLHAEIQLARTAFPDRPLHVVKIDLKDFYPSIPHDVLLTILQKCGVPQRDRQFFERFLSPPLLAGPGAKPARMRRGVPMGFTLSGALAELLLRFLDLHIRRRARVRIVRRVDDLCLLTAKAEEAEAGWKAVEEFCAACGLQLNRAKSGAVCLGGVLPAGLPHDYPRWGMLELDDKGNWSVHEETFQAHLSQTRERVNAAASVFAKVQQYNANVRFLLNALALNVDLGEVHRQSTWQAIRTFHSLFFGASLGVVAGLVGQIRGQFQADVSDVPDGWVYWPLTAGGLGLQNPLVKAGQYAVSYRRRKRREPPRDRPPGWDTQENEWSEYYRWLLEPLEEAAPEDTKVMKTLVEDFIQRGQHISAGKQKGLSSYWRWVLYTYGPQIQQKFGTFRFLLPELVPMQLIGAQRLQDSSLDGQNA
jgi:hypothetical protein